MKTRLALALAAGLLLAACNLAAGGDGGPAAPRPGSISRSKAASSCSATPSRSSGTPPAMTACAGSTCGSMASSWTLPIPWTATSMPMRCWLQGQVDWAPAQAGEYLIQVEPTGPDDVEGQAAENRVHVYAEGGTIAGMVAKDLNLDGDAQDDGEGPLEGATVIVVYCGDKLSMRTDERGRFEFTNVPIGICTITAEKPGWFFAGTHPAELEWPIQVFSDPELPNLAHPLPIPGGHPHSGADGRPDPATLHPDGASGDRRNEDPDCARPRYAGPAGADDHQSPGRRPARLPRQHRPALE